MSKKQWTERDVDYAKLDATTDEDIARQIAEDPDTAPDMADWDLTPARVVDGRKSKHVVKPAAE